MCTCNLPFLNVGAVIFQRHSVGQTKHDVGWVWPMAHQFMAFAVKNNFVISIGVFGAGGALGGGEERMGNYMVSEVLVEA